MDTSDYSLGSTSLGDYGSSSALGSLSTDNGLGGNSWWDSLLGAASTGAKIYGSVTAANSASDLANSRASVTALASRTQSATSLLNANTLSKIVPWIIGGVALMLTVLLFTGVFRRGK